MTENKPLDHKVEESQEPQQEEETLNLGETESKARQQVISRLDEVILSVVKGHSLNAKKQLKALGATADALKMMDSVLNSVINDIMRLIHMTATTQASMWSNVTMTQAILKMLDQKGIISEAEIREFHEKELVPELIKEIKNYPEQEEKEEEVQSVTEDHSDTLPQTSPQSAS